MISTKQCQCVENNVWNREGVLWGILIGSGHIKYFRPLFAKYCVKEIGASVTEVVVVVAVLANSYFVTEVCDRFLLCNEERPAK